MANVIGSILQREHYEKFLMRAYFGRAEDGDCLHLAIDAAYRDMCRTLRGIARQPSGDRRECGRDRMRLALQRLRDGTPGRVERQDAFDRWHHDLCDELVGVYRERGCERMRIGQAQKWINMTWKYIFTVSAMDEDRLSGFGCFYPLCHIPLDRIVLEGLERYGAPQLGRPWSRLGDYETYLGYQHWVRDRFRIAPLDVEFYLWMGCDVSRWMREGEDVSATQGTAP